MVAYCRHVPKHACPSLENLRGIHKVLPLLPAPPGWEAQLWLKDKARPPAKASLPAGSSQHVWQQATHIKHVPCSRHGANCFYTPRTLFDCHTNPHLASEDTKAERCSEAPVEPLTWVGAPQELDLGLSKVKACLLALGETWCRPSHQQEHIIWHQFPFFPYLHTTHAIIYLLFSLNSWASCIFSNTS